MKDIIYINDYVVTNEGQFYTVAGVISGIVYLNILKKDRVRGHKIHKYERLEHRFFKLVIL